MAITRRLYPHGDACVGVLLICLLGTPIACSGAAENRPDEEHATRIYKQVVAATVFLSSSYTAGTARASSIGSGFIVDNAGTILTNAHVVDGAHTVMAKLYDGQRVKVDVIGIDRYSDIAVLKLKGFTGKLPTLRLGSSERLRIGQRTLVIGNPYGLGFGLSSGILSGIDRLPPTLNFAEPRVPLLQTTAPLNPGDSGGPLLNSEGRVIGVTTSILAGTQNIGFAIPIDVVKEVFAELKANGKVVRPWMGVAGKLVTEEIRDLFVLPLSDGLLVEEVIPGSPAAEAGLRAGAIDVVVAGEPWMMGGDLIVSVQDHALHSIQDFIDTMKTLKVGDRVPVEYIRDRVRARLTVVVSERPPGAIHPLKEPFARTGDVSPRAGRSSHDLDGMRLGL